MGALNLYYSFNSQAHYFISTILPQYPIEVIVIEENILKIKSLIIVRFENTNIY